MKYTFECSEKETEILANALSEIVSLLVGCTVHIDREEAPEEDVDDDRPLPPPLQLVPTAQAAEEAAAPEEAGPVETPEQEKERKLLERGRRQFDKFLTSWLQGIDMETMGLIEGVEQPNREILLRDLCNSPNAYPVIRWIMSVGGLQHAIYEIRGDKDLARKLPDYIVPPASIVFSDLADTYEYTNPWPEEE